jgi:hypothetical protein
VIGPFPDLGAVFARCLETRVDALLVHTYGLHDDSLCDLKQAASCACAPGRRAYGYATQAGLRKRCRSRHHAPARAQDDRTLAGVAARDSQFAGEHHGIPGAGVLLRAIVEEACAVPPRRYDDATLADFAGLSSSFACECPSTSPSC